MDAGFSTKTDLGKSDFLAIFYPVVSTLSTVSLNRRRLLRVHLAVTINTQTEMCMWEHVNVRKCSHIKPELHSWWTSELLCNKHWELTSMFPLKLDTIFTLIHPKMTFVFLHHIIMVACTQLVVTEISFFALFSHKQLDQDVPHPTLVPQLISEPKGRMCSYPY